MHKLHVLGTGWAKTRPFYTMTHEGVRYKYIGQYLSVQFFVGYFAHYDATNLGLFYFAHPVMLTKWISSGVKVSRNAVPVPGNLSLERSGYKII